MKKSLVAIFVVSMLVGCVPINVSVPKETKEALDVTEIIQLTTTAETQITPTSLNTNVPTPVELIAPPAGIVYRAEMGLWLVEKEGEPTLLYSPIDDNYYSLDPTGKYIFYLDYAADGQNRVNQYVVDISTGNKIQIYPRDNLSICLFTWVPGHPDYLYTVLLPEGADPGYSCQRGSPVLQPIDGSDLLILDPDLSGWSGPSISPNGELIAFNKEGQPWIYEWGKTPRIFDTESYGIPQSDAVEFSAPSWSPDSTKLAWIRLDRTQPEEQKHIIIFDIEEQTFNNIYPCRDDTNFECGLNYFEGFPSIEWSGDGNYLSVVNFSLDYYSIFSVDGEYEKMLDDGFYSLEWSPLTAWYARIEGAESCLEVFIESADEQESHQVGCGRNLLWSPDGNEVIFGEKAYGWWRVDINTWDVNQIDLPAESDIIDWVNFPD